MTPILINGTEYYLAKQVRNELAKRDRRCKRLENDLVKCRKEISELNSRLMFVRQFTK